MQVSAMIEMAPQQGKAAAPGKVTDKSDQSFGKVLKEKQQPQQLKDNGKTVHQAAEHEEKVVTKKNNEPAGDVEQKDIDLHEPFCLIQHE